MFREMRRKKQQLPQSETVQIVNEATCAIVGVIRSEERRVGKECGS